MNSIDRFKSLGGTFETCGDSVYIVYKDKRMRIPQSYFSSPDVVDIEVLEYYLNTIPKLDDSKASTSVIGYPNDLDLLTTCGTVCVKDCTSCEELCMLLKTKGEDE